MEFRNPLPDLDFYEPVAEKDRRRGQKTLNFALTKFINLESLTTAHQRVLRIYRGPFFKDCELTEEGRQFRSLVENKMAWFVEFKKQTKYDPKRFANPSDQLNWFLKSTELIFHWHPFTKGDLSEAHLKALESIASHTKEALETCKEKLVL